MRHLFIINPEAGKRKSRKQIEGLLSGLSFEFETVYTEKAGDAWRIANEAASAGEPVRIYVCGGDGTLNEAVNGAAGHSNAAVTNIPTGTGNDFLKIFGSDYQKLFSDIEALAKGPEASFDLIDCNGRLGIDIVCAGVDARIAADVHKYKKLPLVKGIGAYILAMLENVLFKGVCRPMSVEMGDTVRKNCPTAMVCVCSGRYYGGGFMPVGEANPDDGILDILHVGKVNFFTFIRVVGKYAKGRYKEEPGLINDYHGAGVVVYSDEEITAVVDGEVMKDKRFNIKLSDKKINFFYPSGAEYRV